jgi:hypothetical protein
MLSLLNENDNPYVWEMSDFLIKKRFAWTIFWLSGAFDRGFLRNSLIPQDTEYASHTDVQFFGDRVASFACRNHFENQFRLCTSCGARPLYFPADFALAIPSRCRSSMTPRSNSAIAPSKFSISFPVGVPVSMFRFRMRRATNWSPDSKQRAQRWAIERARRSSLVTCVS